MIILKIVKKGYFIEIPGLPPFRTPVEANISHISIPLVVSKLQSQGIKEFEIISDTKGKQSVLNQNDFSISSKKEEKKKEKQESRQYEERVNKLEYLLKKLLQKQDSDSSSKKEQITKLNAIESLLKKQATKIIHVDSRDEPVPKQKIEELEDETFIPSINLDNLELKGKSSKKTIKQDKTDIDDSADLLSRIIQADK